MLVTCKHRSRVCLLASTTTVVSHLTAKRTLFKYVDIHILAREET